MDDMDIKNATIEELLSVYAESAAINGQSSINGDFKSANRHYRILSIVCRELGERGIDAQRSLLRLLAHDDPAVRLWTASHVIEFAPKEGIMALMELADREGTTGFEAETMLSEWKEGKFRFP
jgi:hypothetical protein